MQFEDYQIEAMKTKDYENSERQLICGVFGLCGESGEVAEKVKKAYRENSGVIDTIIQGEIVKELGDVLWYIASLANVFNLSISDIAMQNVIKLRKRKKEGKIYGNGDNR